MQELIEQWRYHVISYLTGLKLVGGWAPLNTYSRRDYPPISMSKHDRNHDTNTLL